MSIVREEHRSVLHLKALYPAGLAEQKLALAEVENEEG